MRFIGHHAIRTVDALPVTGQSGEQVIYNNELHTWHEGFQSWEPPLGWKSLVLAVDKSDATIGPQEIFSFPVVANALYEFRYHLRQRSTVNGCGLRLRLTTPAGAEQYLSGQSVTGFVSTSQPQIISMCQSGYDAVFSNNSLFNVNVSNRGRGVIKTGPNAGQAVLSFGINTAGNGATIVVAAKSSLYYRRIA